MRTFLVPLGALLVRSSLTIAILNDPDIDDIPVIERIQAQGLLGSHFGRTDVAASYDYIVVGGGTAGLVVARRLASQYTVAVIEAGSFYEFTNSNLSEIPADASYYLGKSPSLQNPLVDWGQMTTPQPDFGGRPVLYPQGRTLGGSSARNFMWYQRGSTGSYQQWAEAVDDRSYNFLNFLPYFKKSVHFSPPNQNLRAANATPVFNSTLFSSSGGPLQVSWPNFASPAASWVALGANALGLQELPGGMQDGNLLGWSWIANTIDPSTQIRSTSETSFLREALEQTSGLTVYQNSLAKRVLFKPDKTAHAVEVESAALGSSSVRYTINATKEVIIASGSFRSPQLLMVSGIGPTAALQDNGIEVLVDRPGVGQGMWDHVFSGPSYNVDTVTHNWLADPAYQAQATEEYINNRTGILTNVGGDILGKFILWALTPHDAK